MKVIKYENKFRIEIIKSDGEPARRDIDYLSKLKGWKALADHMISYCIGKEYSSITSWLSRIASVMKPTINDAKVKSVPSSSKQWTLFIKNLYLVTLTTDTIKSKIETRVAIWNKNIRPFFEYLQERDYIPQNVIIPSMKSVDQHEKNSSFNIKLIGEKDANKVKHTDSLDRLLTPVSLSRTDAEYLDEVYYDLERKRNKLHQCLVNYWKNLKAHFELGNELIGNLDIKSLEARLNENDIYNLYQREGCVPPIRRHIATEESKESLGILLYIFKTRLGYFKAPTKKLFSLAPCSTAIYSNTKYIESILPSCFLENYKPIGISERLNWMLGIIGNKDVSYIAALLMMENPKFTFEALLDSKIEDRYGKTWLEVNETSISFSVDKKRAKALKKENLSDLSIDIIATLIKIRENYKHLIPNSIIKRLFIIFARNTSNKYFTPPQKSRVSCYLTGLETHTNDKKQQYEVTHLNSFFPSLDNIGLKKRTLTHKKLRDSEGVLEYFRTGSIKAVSRKLGNSNRVVLEHYLPKTLIAAFNTRQVRRFQNLLIVAASINESYLLDAVDFNTLSELHNFISDMLSLDNKGTNPLLNYIREQSNTSNNKPAGELIANISEKSLTVLYAYNLVAENNNIEASVLSKKDIATGLSPISFISLSKHLHGVLSSHSDAKFRNTNKIARKQAKLLSVKVNWGNLLLSRKRLV